MSFDPQSHVVPEKLEDPIPILFWSPIEFTLAISFAGFGLVMNLWFIGLGMSAAVLIGSRYLARGAKRGSVQHLIWSLGLRIDTPLKTQFPAPWTNEFIC